MYLENSLKWKLSTFDIWYSPRRVGVCGRTLMVCYFDLNLCDKSTFPAITFSREYAVELSSVYYNFLSVVI